MQLILASQSLGRKKLLELTNIPFQIIPSTLDEDKIIGKTPLETIKLRSRLKGKDVAGLLASFPKLPKSLKLFKEKQEFLILSADSGVIIDNQLIGKPRDYEDAVRILQTLSGRTHEFVTAVYLSKLPKSLKSLRKTSSTFDRSLITFKKLSLTTIKRYLAHSDYKKYAGGYALFDHPKLIKPTLSDLLSDKSYKSILKPVNPQLHSRCLESLDLIDNIEGSISNVIGLPLEKVIPILQKMRIV